MDKAMLEELLIFPGGDLVVKGLRDLARGIVSVESLLVQMASPRLSALGFEISQGGEGGDLYEHRLFDLLCSQNSRTAYGTYNGLIARMVSFVNAYAKLGRARVR